MSKEKIIKVGVDAKDGIKEVDKLKKGIKDTSSAAAGSKGAFSKMTTAAKGLGVAFKAMGIGLVVAAFVKLQNIFSGNIETARIFERVSARLGAAFDVIRDRAEEFIRSLIKLKNPIKAIRESFSGMGKEIREETKAMDQFTVALQKVRDEERAMTVIRAEANKVIAESRLLAEDETKTMQERLVALKAAVAEEQRVASLELETQSEKVKNLQAIIDLGKSSEQDLIELENERAKLIDLQTASVLKQKRVVTEIVTFERQIEAEKKKNADAELKRIDDANKQKEKERLEAEKEAERIKKEEDKKKQEAEKKAAELKKQKDAELEVLRLAGLNEEELALDQARQKFEKLLALAEKYGQDTTFLTDQYNQQVAEIQAQYDEEELAKAKEKEDEKLAMRQEAGNMALEAGQQIFGALNDIAQAELTAEKNSLKKQLDAGKISQEQFDKQTAKIEERALKRRKKKALLDILISTAQGVAGAIKAGAAMPFPLNLAAIATGVASVLAGIASAKAVLSEVPGESGGGGEPSVDQGGGGEEASPSQIGGDLIPNMENIQPTLGGNDASGSSTVQAFVVETDISNSQALQQELDLQSTL